MRLMAWYGPRGSWLPGIGQAGEDKELPSWPVTVTQEDGRTSPAHNIVLTVEAPEGTKLGDVWPGRQG
jgi:hypothetical protein